MLTDIFLISLTMSVVILGMLALLPLLRKRYSATWRYFVWLIVAIRLVIPFRLEFSGLPQVSIPIEPVVPVEVSLTPETNMPIVTNQLSQQSAEYSETKKSVPLGQILLGLWATGAVSFLAYHIISYAVFMRKIKRHCKPSHIKSTLQVKTCSEISAPMLIGLFKPIILLPETNYTDKELSVVLQHELTHHKRRDLWYKLLLIVGNSMHFFNPLVYLMVKQANRDLEFACDDAVVSNQDIEFRREYSLIILKAMQNATKYKASPLTTYLSESAKGSKVRFENILSITKKRTGVIAFAMVTILVGVGGALVACNENSPTYADSLYECKDTLAGDNSHVVAIVDLLPTHGFERGAIELHTDAQPFKIWVHYQTEDRATIRDSKSEFINKFAKNAAIMLSLIPNADSILIILDDKYGEIGNGYYSRDNIGEHLQTDQINRELVQNAAQSPESFNNFVELLNNIPLPKPVPIANENKIIYEIIGSDREIVTNSGYGFSFTIDKPIKLDGLDIEALAKEYDVDIKRYLGKEIRVCGNQIENYKTKERVPYIYVFCQDELVAYKDLETQENEKLVIDKLIELDAKLGG